MRPLLRVRPASVTFAAALLLVVAGCVTPPVSMEAPEGFALYDDQETVRAVSPEGVLVRARSVENEPRQDLEFWAEALERQLTESGYLLIERTTFDGESGPGVLMEWLAPVNEADWIYLTAISVVDARIAIVESAGPADHYQEYRDAIRRSLRTLSLDQTEQTSE